LILGEVGGAGVIICFSAVRASYASAATAGLQNRMDMVKRVKSDLIGIDCCGVVRIVRVVGFPSVSHRVEPEGRWSGCSEGFPCYGTMCDHALK
jgi:hypothetical protein